MKIASTKKENALEGEAEPEDLAEGGHEVRPQQAELEAEDRAGDDADGEEGQHHLRPALGERPVDAGRRCAATAPRRTARWPGRRSRSRPAGCGRRTTSPASGAPRAGTPDRPARTAQRRAGTSSTGLRPSAGGLGGKTAADEVTELPDGRIANPVVDHARLLAAMWPSGKLALVRVDPGESDRFVATTERSPHEGTGEAGPAYLWRLLRDPAPNLRSAGQASGGYAATFIRCHCSWPLPFVVDGPLCAAPSLRKPGRLRYSE